MKKKNSYRWDRVFGLLTVIALIICCIITYFGLKVEHIEDDGILTHGTAAPAVAQNTQSQDDRKVVCLDPGHGGIDGGASFGEALEKNQVLSICLALKDELTNRNVKVVMTRDSDVKVELDSRPVISNEANADAFVSIHRNYYKGSSSVHGVETWISSDKPQDAYDLAASIMKHIGAIPNVKNRGIKTGTMNNPNTNYKVNSDTKAASCLIELGFITSSLDDDLVNKNKEQTVKAIADGIMEYLDGTGN